MARIPSGEHAPEAAADWRGRRRWQSLAARLAGPGLILAAALVLPAHILSTSRTIRGSGLGPTAWPRVMLALIAVLTAVWMVQEWLAWRRGRPALTAPATGTGDAYSMRLAVAGLALVVLYGWLLPIVGFPIATTAFVALWCLLGGIRNRVALVAVPLVGTAALLWIFMGLATMPLTRGVGIFDRISIALLQMLGIY